MLLRRRAAYLFNRYFRSTIFIYFPGNIYWCLVYNLIIFHIQVIFHPTNYVFCFVVFCHAWVPVDMAKLLRIITIESRKSLRLPFNWHSLPKFGTWLTHWGRDKMAAISQTTLWTAFSWMKMLEFRLKFHWSLPLRVQLTIFQHWFR